MDQSEDQGYAGFYDERSMGALAPMPKQAKARANFRASTMMGIRGMGAIGDLFYDPDLSDVGHGSSYWPGDTYNDAVALEYLGYRFPNPNFGHTSNEPYGGSEFQGTNGSQAADMSGGGGAWNQDFRNALMAFQSDHGMAADGWIGPETRAAISAAVDAKNGGGGGALPPAPRPNDLELPDDYHGGDMPIPPNRGGGGGATPVSTMTDTKKYALIGGGALALLAVGYYLMK